MNQSVRVSAISISDLRRTYVSRKNRVVEAVANFSIAVKNSERIALVGPSGCGKSTLLRILAGLDAEYDGEIAWAAVEDSAERLRCATVFQVDSTLPWMTVEKNLAIGLSGLRLDEAMIQRRIDNYLSLVGLRKFRTSYPHELSGGMRQRVAIARALVTEPLLLLMDEPLAALDAQTRIVMQQELYNILEQTHSTVIYITHDIDEALSLADRIIVMTARPGRIKAVVDVPFARSVDPLQRRTKSDFGDLQVAIWKMVAEEVGQSLRGPGDARP
jgi:ABC-type nitrate/sulfonate/bicarbonate transport system ATPase subunit